MGSARRGRPRRPRAARSTCSSATAWTRSIHFAAYAYVGESVTNPRKYFRNNVAGTLNLLDAMLDAGVRDIVFSSTCATYGEPQRGADRRGPPAEPGQPVRRDQARGRADAALVRAGATASGTRRCATSTPPAPIPTARSARTTIRRRTSSRWRSRRRSAARRARDLRHRLPDARRHGDPRLHPRRRSGRRARARAGRSCGTGTTALRLNLGTGRGHSVREVIAAVEKVSGQDGAARARSAGAPAIRRRWSPTRGRPPRSWAGSRATRARDHRRARLALAQRRDEERGRRSR